MFVESTISYQYIWLLYFTIVDIMLDQQILVDFLSIIIQECTFTFFPYLLVILFFFTL